jgi:hypothetical protein
MYSSRIFRGLVWRKRLRFVQIHYTVQPARAEEVGCLDLFLYEAAQNFELL